MASRREVVVATENYLRSKGYNNSTGKYDRVIMGVKSLLGETLLTYGSPEFERAIQQETERMLKKYVKDEAMEYDPIMCMMVPVKDQSFVVSYKDKKDNGVNKTVNVEANNKNEAIQKAINKFRNSNEDVVIVGASAKDQRTVDFSSSDAKKVFEYIDKHFQKSFADTVRKMEAAKTPEECEKLEIQARKEKEDIMDEYLAIWNMVGLYAQHARNDVSSSYDSALRALFRRYNEMHK